MENRILFRIFFTFEHIRKTTKKTLRTKQPVRSRKCQLISGFAL